MFEFFSGYLLLFWSSLMLSDQEIKCKQNSVTEPEKTHKLSLTDYKLTV